MLEQGEVLTLNDNKKYSVVFVTKYNNKDYVYLIDQDDYLNNMFCEYKDNKLETVNNAEIIEELLKLFAQTNNI